MSALERDVGPVSRSTAPRTRGLSPDAAPRPGASVLGMSFAKNLLKTGSAVAVSATLGTLATDPKTRWYKSLDKPEIQPPAAVFPIAWTALYATIAGASAKALTAGEEAAEARPGGLIRAPHQQEEAARRVRSYKRALGVNLVLNTGWSALFFQGKNPPLAAVEATLLAVSSADLARRAWQLDRASGVLLLPYAAWTAFATALTVRIDQEN